MRRLLPFVAVAVLASAVTAAAIVVPAWAGEGERKREGTIDERIREFDACMREHGFDFGRETEIIVRPGEVTINGRRVDAERFREAQRDCGPPFHAPFGLVPHRGELPGLDGMPGIPDDLRERVERLERCLEEAKEL